MIRSMTAFAREETVSAWGSAIWELRSVNFRYLDISTRLPEDLRSLEPTIREHVANCLSRGKVECSLRYQPALRQDTGLTVNKTLVANLASASHEIDGLLDGVDSLRAVDILRWPGVIESSPPDMAVVSAGVLAVLDEALKNLLAMREREGEKIFTMLATRCDEILIITNDLSAALPGIQETMKTRLHNKLADVSDKLDEERVEQEMVLFANKMDVSEELDRLAAHIEEVRHVITESKPVGRRLDFLMQELNREANTLGAKSVDTKMTRASVDLKVLIEQMREQIQNIE